MRWPHQACVFLCVLCAEMCARKNSFTYRRNFTFFPLLCSVSESSIFEKKHDAEMRCRLPIVTCLIKGAPVSAQHHICYCLLHSSRLRSGVRLLISEGEFVVETRSHSGENCPVEHAVGQVGAQGSQFFNFQGP